MEFGSTLTTFLPAWVVWGTTFRKPEEARSWKMFLAVPSLFSLLNRGMKFPLADRDLFTLMWMVAVCPSGTSFLWKSWNWM